MLNRIQEPLEAYCVVLCCDVICFLDVPACHFLTDISGPLGSTMTLCPGPVAAFGRDTKVVIENIWLSIFANNPVAQEEKIIRGLKKQQAPINRPIDFFSGALFCFVMIDIITGESDFTFITVTVISAKSDKHACILQALTTQPGKQYDYNNKY